MSKYKDQLPLRDQVLYEFGRLVVHLQVIELRIKNLLLAAQFTINPIHAAKRETQIRKSTFGGLKTELFESFLVVPSPKSEAREEDSTQFVFKAEYSLVMPVEARDKYKADLSSLIDDRNDLIHHFLTRYDLTCDVGCDAALAHLKELSDRALSIFSSLKEFQRAQLEVKALMHSERYFELRVGRTLPPGQDWLMIEEVQLLIEAGKLYADESGKVSLQKGVEYITHKGGSEDAYTHYGCKSWQDLAAKTGLFSIERQKNPCSGRWEHFYRLRAKIPL